MSSFKIVRFVVAAVMVAAITAGTFASISAQEATPETDPMMAEMMMMEGACPEGAAAAMLDEMDTAAAGDTVMETTEEPEMMATEETSMEQEEPATEATDEAMMGVSCLFGQFSGLAEVPGPGDDDGVGFAFVSVGSSTGNICYDVAVANITLPAAAMHIHVNAAGLSGDIVVPFPTAPDADGLASGCTTADVEGLAAAIALDPEGYYVNVHTEDFPAGAVRAQLMAWDDQMMDDNQMMDTGEASSVDVGLTEFEIDMPTTIAAGSVTFNIVNNDTEEHGFEVEGQGIEEELEQNLQPGETGTLTVELEPGTYEIYCPVDDHAAQGMQLELTVTGS